MHQTKNKNADVGQNLQNQQNQQMQHQQHGSTDEELHESAHTSLDSSRNFILTTSSTKNI